MSEEIVIRNCAPTLAGIKTGSLFSYAYESKDEVTESIRQLNLVLGPKGLRVLPVRISDKRALIYVYRPRQLCRDLKGELARQVLEKRGYPCDCPERCVAHLVERIHEEAEFPHEVGLFLGYPPEDVAGFIQNHAAHSKLTGYWKVYGDVQSAEAAFAKIRKCTAIYCSRHRGGVSLSRLAVNA